MSEGKVKSRGERSELAGSEAEQTKQVGGRRRKKRIN